MLTWSCRMGQVGSGAQRRQHPGRPLPRMGPGGTHGLSFGSSGPRPAPGSFHAGTSRGSVAALVPLGGGEGWARVGKGPDEHLHPGAWPHACGLGPLSSGGTCLPRGAGQLGTPCASCPMSGGTVGVGGGQGASGNTCLTSCGPIISRGPSATWAASIPLEEFGEVGLTSHRCWWQGWDVHLPSHVPGACSWGQGRCAAAWGHQSDGAGFSGACSLPTLPRPGHRGKWTHIPHGHLRAFHRSLWRVGVLLPELGHTVTSQTQVGEPREGTLHLWAGHL